MRMTRPMWTALRRVVKNETIGARNMFRYKDQTLYALIRRELVFIRNKYVLPTALGMLTWERKEARSER